MRRVDWWFWFLAIRAFTSMVVGFILIIAGMGFGA